MGTQWYQRLVSGAGAPTSASPHPIADVLARRGDFSTAQEYLEAAQALLVAGTAMDDSAASTIFAELARENWTDAETTRNQGQFLRGLSAHTGDDRPLVFLAEVLLRAECYDEALAAFLDAAEINPGVVAERGTAFAELASRQRGEYLLRYRLAHARSALADGADDVRELYSELLEDYADDPAAMACARQLGNEIDEAVAAGRLPKAMVLRGMQSRKT